MRLAFGGKISSTRTTQDQQGSLTPIIKKNLYQNNQPTKGWGGNPPLKKRGSNEKNNKKRKGFESNS